MTLAEFLADPDAWLGREVTVEGGWLHSDGFEAVCLTDGPRFERELVAVEAAWVARWLNSHIPPRPGAPSAYMFEASVKGTVQPRSGGGVRCWAASCTSSCGTPGRCTCGPQTPNPFMASLVKRRGGSGETPRVPD